MKTPTLGLPFVVVCLVLICITSMLLWTMINDGMTRTTQKHGQKSKAKNIRDETNQSTLGHHTDSAFFTLLAGIDPSTTKEVSHPHSYLGYLLHLATVRYMLDHVGSTSDFVILLRLVNTVRGNTLPKSQLDYLSKLRMNIEYLPQNDDDSWGSYMMEKFHIFRYHRYNHILFLDADVLPLCNLDIYFERSDQGMFASNVVIAYNHEPAQGGFFLVSPEPGDWEVYQRTSRFINKTVGFGSPLTGVAEGTRRNYTEWNWHGADADQGLLYHWVRYVKKDVTIIKKNSFQNWKEQRQGGQVEMVHQNLNFSSSATCTTPSPASYVWRPENIDFMHFTGLHKPWVQNWTAKSTTSTDMPSSSSSNTKIYAAWAAALRLAWHKYELGPLRTLIPNMDGDDIDAIELFLRRE